MVAKASGEFSILSKPLLNSQVLDPERFYDNLSGFTAYLGLVIFFFRRPFCGIKKYLVPEYEYVRSRIIRAHPIRPGERKGRGWA